MASKAQIIEDRKANLPLPEQPPVPSDWNSGDASKVSHDADAKRAVDQTDDTLRDAAISVGGRQEKDELKGLPNDVVVRESKGKEGLVGTTK